MSPDDYQQQALRTEYTPEFAAITTAPGQPRKLDEQMSRIMHAMIGICTESGELQDQVKKHLIYGQALDITNVMEEISDVLWYCALGLDACGFKMSDAMTRNIDKLRKRFPDKFTSEHALNRDLDAERKALEDRTALVQHQAHNDLAISGLIARLRAHAAKYISVTGDLLHEAANVIAVHAGQPIQSGRLVADPTDDSRSARANVEITDLDPHRDADHALEALRCIAHRLGVDSPIKLRDPSNKHIAELCCKKIDLMRADLCALRKARDAFIATR